MFAQYQEMRRTAEVPKTIKLYYFDATGRAEAIRAVLAVGGVKYDDVRLPREEWQKMKPNAPLGHMPILEVDGKMVSQSCACARLAAKVAGLSGKSVFEEALADSIVDTVTEIREKFIPTHFEKDEEKKKEMMTDFTTNYMPGKLASLEKFVCDQNGGGEGFFCGGEMTWADLYFVVHMEMLAPGMPTWDEGYPKLKALTTKVTSDPKVKAYNDNKPAKK